MSRKSDVNRIRSELKKVSNNNLGTFSSLKELKDKYPERQGGNINTTLDENSYAFVDDGVHDIEEYKYTSKGKWKKVGGSGGGGGKDSAILDELEKNNILYYRVDAIKNPVEGDRRDTGLGLGRNADEVYTGGQWVKKIEVGSVGTDMITLRSGLNDIKVKENNRTFNIARKLKTMEGIQIGSSFSPLALTADSVKNTRVFYPDSENLRKFGLNDIRDQKITLPAYAELHWTESDSIIKSIILCTEKESRMRIRLYYTDVEMGTPIKDIIPTLSDGALVYESMPDAEFKNPENKECYGGVVVPEGISEIELRNEMYLTNEKRYIIEFDSCIESHFMGNGSIPYCGFNFWYEKNELIATETILEERLKNDIVLGYNMWLGSNSKPVEGEKPKEYHMIGIREEDFLDIGAITVGDDGAKTMLWTDRDAYIKSSNDRIEHLTSYERMTMEAIPKIYNVNQCIEGQIALLIETKPKTYTSWERKFPIYKLGDINNRVYRFACTFAPVLGRANRLFTDFGSRRLDFLHGENDSMGIRFGYYLDNGDYVDYAVNLQDIEKLREDSRWTVPKNAYMVDSSRTYEELKRPWKVDIQVIDNDFILTIVDPDLLRWVFVDTVVDVEGEDIKPKPSHIFSGGEYYVGHFNQSETVRILQNVNINSKNDTIVNNINENITEINPIKLITRQRKQIFDVNSTDSMAIHKFPDKTKDFHTFFDPTASGVYRCFGMTENIPEGYFAGDNDFYAFVYAVSQEYKTVEIMDIRSGRRFTKCMLAGKWNDWFEWGINQGGQIPKLVFANRFSGTGSPTELSLSSFSDNCTVDDVYWVTCGSRGQAIQVESKDYLMNYAASFWIDKTNAKLWYYQESQGMDTKNLAVYKFVNTPVTPPRGGCPYVTLNGVLEDLSTSTKKGDRFNIELDTKSVELMRNLSITINTWGRWENVNVIFDGKAKYYFEFPWNMTTSWEVGSEVTYQLSWQDQNGMNYTGFEKVVKSVVS